MYFFNIFRCFRYYRTKLNRNLPNIIYLYIIFKCFRYYRTKLNKNLPNIIYKYIDYSEDNLTHHFKWYNIM
jgi:hypothetical protein